jgi:DNA-binding LacI/PurR family transcriptional regulator
LLAHNKVPVISVGMAIPSAETDWIAVDREISFARIVNFALEKGLTRLGFLDSDRSKIFSAMKRQVFERILRQKGLDCSAAEVIEVFDIKAIGKTVTAFITQHPDLEGIVLTDNGLAPFIQMIIADRPIQLFGFGDDIFVALCNPPIPYAQLPMRQLAQMAVEHILNKIENPSNAAPLKTLIPCELVT